MPKIPCPVEGCTKTVPEFSSKFRSVCAVHSPHIVYVLHSEQDAAHKVGLAIPPYRRLRAYFQDGWRYVGVWDVGDWRTGGKPMALATEKAVHGAWEAAGATRSPLPKWQKNGATEIVLDREFPIEDSLGIIERTAPPDSRVDDPYGFTMYEPDGSRTPSYRR